MQPPRAKWRAEVWGIDEFTDGSNPGSGPGIVVSLTNSLDPTGVFKGQWIRIESLDDPVPDYALQMTELEAIGRIVPPFRISLSLTDNGPTLAWTEGTLEAADEVAGTWAPVPGATSPYTVQIVQTRRFYRLKK